MAHICQCTCPFPGNPQLDLSLLSLCSASLLLDVLIYSGCWSEQSLFLTWILLPYFEVQDNGKPVHRRSCSLTVLRLESLLSPGICCSLPPPPTVSPSSPFRSELRRHILGDPFFEPRFGRASGPGTASSCRSADPVGDDALTSCHLLDRCLSLPRDPRVHASKACHLVHVSTCVPSSGPSRELRKWSLLSNGNIPGKGG